MEPSSSAIRFGYLTVESRSSWRQVRFWIWDNWDTASFSVCHFWTAGFVSTSQFQLLLLGRGQAYCWPDCQLTTSFKWYMCSKLLATQAVVSRSSARLCPWHDVGTVDLLYDPNGLTLSKMFEKSAGRQILEEHLKRVNFNGRHHG